MIRPRQLAADGGDGDVEIELLLQELLDVLELEIIVLLEEGDDSLQCGARDDLESARRPESMCGGSSGQDAKQTSRCHGRSFSAPLTFLSGLRWPRVRSCLRRRLMVRSSTSMIFAMSPLVSLGACSRCTSTPFSVLSRRREFALGIARVRDGSGRALCGGDATPVELTLPIRLGQFNCKTQPRLARFPAVPGALEQTMSVPLVAD